MASLISTLAQENASINHQINTHKLIWEALHRTLTGRIRRQKTMLWMTQRRRILVDREKHNNRTQRTTATEATCYPYLLHSEKPRDTLPINNRRREKARWPMMLAGWLTGWPFDVDGPGPGKLVLPEQSETVCERFRRDAHAFKRFVVVVVVVCACIRMCRVHRGATGRTNCH